MTSGEMNVAVKEAGMLILSVHRSQCLEQP